MQWLSRRLGGGLPVIRFDQTGLIVEAVATGAGLAILPCAVAPPDPRLKRISPPIDALTADYWLINHRDAARAPWVRSAIDLLTETFRKAALPVTLDASRQ